MITAAKNEGGGPRSSEKKDKGKPDVFRHRGDYVIRFRRARPLTDPHLLIAIAGSFSLTAAALFAAVFDLLPFLSKGAAVFWSCVASLAITGFPLWRQSRRGYERNQIRFSGAMLINPDGRILSQQLLHDFYATVIADEDDPDQMRPPKYPNSRRYAIRARYGDLRRPVSLTGNFLTKRDADAIIDLLDGWKSDPATIAKASTGLHGKQTLLD
ncbi:hypothetical protein [Sulfitobacter sp. R18_1]|uniref:hypothetical protein n=1 Tax=Sulfitobacter sp. R18_1 TaxID=2821104 RepID=UPI001ADA0690|nr:hypothetical protein [Sulfitobacter sp. R18_1]MBO9428732.1 hypothetical protein [Sulfitobacter sp. R18_1]